MSSVIYNLNGNDKTLILDTRAALLQPFTGLNWTDLRLSAMVSITKQSDPNDPTGLAEIIGSGGDADNFYFGFKTSDSNYPAGTNFFGVSTKNPSFPTAAAQILDSPLLFYNVEGQGNLNAYISNGSTQQATNTGIQQTRLQDSLAGTYSGYATLWILQMKRNDPTVNQVNVLGGLSPNNFFDNGVPYSSNTTIATVRSITAAATFTQYFGPFTFASVPNALYFYWPFMNSRLRIHSYVLEKYA